MLQVMNGVIMNRKDSITNQVDMITSKLTLRQLDVLRLIQHGKSNKEIARALNLVEGTVKLHCVAIFQRLNVTNRTQAALLASTIFIGDIGHKGAYPDNPI
jgi:DNA-binding NarL/FixJ family response regulator